MVVGQHELSVGCQIGHTAQSYKCCLTKFSGFMSKYLIVHRIAASVDMINWKSIYLVPRAVERDLSDCCCSPYSGVMAFLIKVLMCV